jgi:hypothetical protein
MQHKGALSKPKKNREVRATMYQTEADRRRHAVQLAAQLPDDYDDALAILDLAGQLVRGFLDCRRPELRDANDSAIVVPLMMQRGACVRPDPRAGCQPPA